MKTEIITEQESTFRPFTFQIKFETEAEFLEFFSKIGDTSGRIAHTIYGVLKPIADAL